MSFWTHALCVSCYAAVEPGHRPHRIRGETRGALAEICCRCRAHTTDGIYYRADPATLLCGGKGGTH